MVCEHFLRGPVIHAMIGFTVLVMIPAGEREKPGDKFVVFVARHLDYVCGHAWQLIRLPSTSPVGVSPPGLKCGRAQSKLRQFNFQVCDRHTREIC
jgi:hypothetical protein